VLLMLLVALIVPGVLPGALMTLLSGVSP